MEKRQSKSSQTRLHRLRSQAHFKKLFEAENFKFTYKNARWVDEQKRRGVKVSNSLQELLEEKRLRRFYRQRRIEEVKREERRKKKLKVPPHVIQKPDWTERGDYFSIKDSFSYELTPDAFLVVNSSFFKFTGIRREGLGLDFKLAGDEFFAEEYGDSSGYWRLSLMWTISKWLNPAKTAFERIEISPIEDWKDFFEGDRTKRMEEG